MYKSIRSFSKHKTALTSALLLAVFSLFFVIPMAIVFSFMPMVDAQGSPVNAAFPASMLLLMPILYFILGYLSTLLFTALYNVIARFTGGIAFELAEENS